MRKVLSERFQGAVGRQPHPLPTAGKQPPPEGIGQQTPEKDRRNLRGGVIMGWVPEAGDRK